MKVTKSLSLENLYRNTEKLSKMHECMTVSDALTKEELIDNSPVEVVAFHTYPSKTHQEQWLGAAEVEGYI